MEPITSNRVKKILLVEDDPANRKLIEEACMVAGCAGNLFAVDNADKLIRFLNQEYEANSQLPDLILLDLNLPGKSGIEAIPEIKNDNRFKDIPIICLTGSNAEADIKACSQYGCKYVLKPSRFHELINLVKSLPELL